MKIKKTCCICIIFLMLFIFINPNIYAKEVFGLGKEWLNKGEEEAEKNDDFKFGQSFGEIEDLAGILFGAGIFVIIGCGMVIGIKFMLGSAEQRAQLQKATIIYGIGSVLILGALTIWKISINIIEGVI